MSGWPNNRKFVDASGNILDPWQRPLTSLAPLLDLTDEDFAALKALIAAAQEAEEEGVDVFDALPTNLTPDFATDFVVGYDGAGYKTPMSAFAGAPVLLDTVTFSGTETSVSIPPGYTNIELRVKGISCSSNGSVTIAFSEDGGTTLLTQAIHLFNHATSNAGSVAGAGTFIFSSLVAANNAYGRMTVFDYASSEAKFVEESGLIPAGTEGWFGTRVLTSTAPINAVRYAAAAGSFDAGTVELWGTP